jgi:hypothetical protein
LLIGLIEPPALVQRRRRLVGASVSAVRIGEVRHHAKAVHTLELRAALSEAYVAAGTSVPSFTDPSMAAGTPVQALHISELRELVLTLESTP